MGTRRLRRSSVARGMFTTASLFALMVSSLVLGCRMCFAVETVPMLLTRSMRNRHLGSAQLNLAALRAAPHHLNAAVSPEDAVPLGDHVLVEERTMPAETSSGIFLSEKAKAAEGAMKIGRIRGL